MEKGATATTASRLAKAAALRGVKLNIAESGARNPLKLQPRERSWFASEVVSSCATAALMRERKAPVGTLMESSGAKAEEKKADSLAAIAIAAAHDSHAATCAAASLICSWESSPSAYACKSPSSKH